MKPGGSVPLLPVIVHLSGGRRGKTQPLAGNRLVIGTAPTSDIHLSPVDAPAAAPTHGELRRHQATYRLTVAPDQRIWVNGESVAEATLESGDVLEIGRRGPVLRFRLYPPGRRYRKTLREAFSDCADCARHGATTRLGRLAVFLSSMPSEVAFQTSWLFRVVVLIALVALAASTWSLARRSARLEERLSQEAQRVTGIAELLERTENRAITAETLREVQHEIEQRLGALEERSEADKRIILAASRSVIFLQGSYGFVDPESGRPLRFAGRDGAGKVLMNPDGSPAVSLDGAGPPVEALFTGTAFVANEEGLLLTNRHVALPWEYDEAAQSVQRQGLTAEMRRFIGYLPKIKEPFDVEFVAASDDADVAILRCRGVTGRVPFLPLVDTPPKAGDGVIVMGYPTGIRALLARTDEKFVAELTNEGHIDFWSVAQRLAESGRIGPLASRGIVGQITTAAVVYDAETTQGGSGGPVLDLGGNVVAVNVAILPEFGGSNLGVPASFAAELLRSVAGNAAAQTTPE